MIHRWSTWNNIRYRDGGHRCDEFGLDPKWIETSAACLAPLYEHWFRVLSYGIDSIPTEGGAILASNHSGSLPFDGMMIYLDVMRNRQPPRVVRPIADHFVSKLPFVGSFYSKVGVVGGSRGNFRRLLELGELLLVFPEGLPGISKPFSERYKLQKWRVGHVELAIRHQAPVIPVAVIGAEEQLPQIARLPVRLFGIPYLPILLTPFPLPVQYHILYGEPLFFAERFSPEEADDPDVLASAAKEVKDAVQDLINKGLAMRKGIF